MSEFFFVFVVTTSVNITNSFSFPYLFFFSSNFSLLPPLCVELKCERLFAADAQTKAIDYLHNNTYVHINKQLCSASHNAFGSSNCPHRNPNWMKPNSETNVPCWSCAWLAPANRAAHLYIFNFQLHRGQSMAYAIWQSTGIESIDSRDNLSFITILCVLIIIVAYLL